MITVAYVAASRCTRTWQFHKRAAEMAREVADIASVTRASFAVGCAKEPLNNAPQIRDTTRL
ncbi:hypothetical protein, partial [Xanthomonas campestris]|uniref:hypothetical protein n=1 Tax=Xanthomonas campestris TaxID=339 RepID=UPI001C8598CB